MCAVGHWHKAITWRDIRPTRPYGLDARPCPFATLTSNRVPAALPTAGAAAACKAVVRPQLCPLPRPPIAQRWRRVAEAADDDAATA